MNDDTTDTPVDDESSIEDQIIKESIVSVAGLRPDQVIVGIKGDPSLRESAPLRQRYTSKVDEHFAELEPHLEELMLNRGIYRLFIGFNSGEVRTNSIFDPLRQEIHDADRLRDPNYLERQFPRIEYQDKIELMRQLYATLRSSAQYAQIPTYWQNILNRRSDKWAPLEQESIPDVLSTVRRLRDVQEYYLRNITICIVQGIVRMQFNCDGTQIIDAHNFKTFLQDNLPE